MERCKGAKRYTGRKMPSCDDGRGCKACWAKFHARTDSDRRKITEAIQAKVRKGHTPWNDPDPDNRASDDGMPMKDVTALMYGHDAGVPSDANEVLHGGYTPSPQAEDFECPWDAVNRGEVSTENLIAGEIGEYTPTETKQQTSDRSKVVAEMQAQRSGPKGPFAPSPYTKESEDASKMRERLTDCFTILAKAIEKAAATIVAGREVPEPPVERPEFTWNKVGQGTPLNVWLETKRVLNAIEETYTKVCMCCIASIGDEPEWVEKSGGRTTVTHHSFAPPTHWRWPVED